MQNATHCLSGILSGGRQRKARQRETILVLLVYILLTVIMTWPLAARLGTHLAGGRDDLWMHQWTFWWAKQSIMEGRSPFYTDLLFYPRGVSLISHNFAWLNIAAWLPLQAIVGSVTAYNLILMAVFALNGFAMYLLAREATGSKPAAFIGGLVYGFWPYVLSHHDHPNLVVICWIPLVLLYLRRMLKGGQKRDALLAALFLFLTGLTRWHLLIMGGVVVGLYLLHKCLREKACRTRRNLGLLMLVGLVAGMPLVPLAAPIAIAQLTWASPEDILIDEQTMGQTDLLAYVLPSRYHPLWGKTVVRLYESFNVNQFYVAFLGYTTIALAFYGTVRSWPQARFWVLVAAVYVALALGPQLRFNGQLYPQVPMPYRLVGDLWFVRILRKPDRFNIFLGLPMAMLASLGTEALLRQRLFGQHPALLVGAVGILISGEYCPIPYLTAPSASPAWYNELAREPDHFAVLDLPTHSHTFDKQYMFYQTTHGKPLVVGHVSRPPREALAFINSVPFLKHLRQHNTMDSTLTDISHQLQPLATANVRYIILHKELASPRQLAAWRDWLTFEPFHEDTDLVVYHTDPRPGRDFTLAHNVTDEVGLIQATFTPTRTVQAGTVEADVRWGSTAAPGRDYDVCLSLVNAADQIAQSQCEPLSPTWPASRWETGEVVRGTYALQVNPFIEAGTYSLTLTLTDPATEVVVGPPFILGPVQMEPLPRVFTEPRPTHPLDVLWEDVILLRGYDLQPTSLASAETLELTLYWQARRRMEASYKIFVHLIDPTTGDIVAQDDAVPRRWTYPTNWWERNEVVQDTIPLPLDSVPPGQYQLVIGLYDPMTGERVPVYSTADERYPDNALPLTTVER